MSGLNPAPGALVTLSKTAAAQATLDIGVPAEVLQARLRVGELLEAKVLPPEGGQDRLELLGQRVTAQLPPEVHPGETLVLQVKGFTGSQIVVKTLGLQDPQNPVPTSNARFARGAPAPAAPRMPPPTMHVPAAPTARGDVFANAALRPSLRQAARTIGDLLRALNFPDTPLTRTVAALSPQSPARIAPVLARLDAALPPQSTDPRIATLRTLLAFVGKFDARNPEALAAQIQGYVSHVKDGPEPKLVRLFRQLDRMPQKLERAAAADHELKSVVLSLLREPAQERTPAMMQALNETFVTLTAAQMQTLSENLQRPDAIALTLPFFFREGGKPAQLRISRDRSPRAQRIDADNFHVAFVLDTANLGTVAVSLQTSARNVTIDVRTEGESAAQRFSTTLDRLRGRLERLRYRVASVAANVTAPKTPRTAARTQAPPASGLDLRA